MSTQLHKLQLFSFDGSYRQATQRFDPTEPFKVPSTQFSNGFEVNRSSNNYDLDKLLTSNYGINGSGQLQETNRSSLSSLLQYGQKTYATDSSLTYQGFTETYKKFLSALSVSDQTMNQLLQQDRFSVYNGRVGINVQTDGNGNIESVSLQPGSKNLRNGTPANFEFPNRAEITLRAQLREANDLGPVNPNPPDTEQTGLQPFKTAPTENNPFQNALRETPKALQTELKGLETRSVTPAGALPESPRSLDADNSPLAQLLRRLQPIEVDTQIFGFDSNLTPDTARQVGAVNGRFGVNYSDSFNQKLSQLREGLAQQEAAKILPERSAQARTATMPAAPYVPSDGTTVVQQGFAGSTSSNQLEQPGTSVDTTDKKSSGGYIPFRTGSDAGGDQQQQHQQQERRKPLFALA